MARLPIPARSGVFVNLRSGNLLKIINTHGTQVVDTWAFASVPSNSTKNSDFDFRYLSMCHTRTALSKLTLGLHDTLRDNAREPMLSLVENTSSGVHDLLFAACDEYRYAQLGIKGFHDSCANNLRTQVTKAVDLVEQEPTNGLPRAIASASSVVDNWTPDPLNLFMNVPAEAIESGIGGKLSMAVPHCPKGSYVVLKAEVDCLVVMSACPMDLTKMYETKGAEYEVISD